MATLVHVEDFGCTVPPDRFVQRPDAEIRHQCIRHAASYYPSTGLVHYGKLVDEAAFHVNVGDVGGQT